VEHPSLTDAALTVSLALAAGILAQSVGRHLRVPGIVLLLGAGVLLGPDVWGIVDPQGLGPALPMLVGFAVAVILFDGALNLNLRRIRREARTIRRLLVIGPLVTAAGGALAARWFMRWDWSLSILFGTLVIVTGPTVITPLLRRIKVKRNVETVLEAEGVLIDAIGAVIAVVTLQIVLSPSGSSIAAGFGELLWRLGFGVAAGLIGGFLIALILRWPRVVPEGLENVLTLSLVFVLYQVSNAVIAESGVMSVTVAGLVVGNTNVHALRDLREFKEQLTLMFIGMLFVLLAADVRLAEVGALGIAGVLTVAGLMFVVRPINVALSTLGSDLTLRERMFISWVAPRGIVAAGLASLVAQTLTAAGIAGGLEVRALVFLVIAATVIVQGMTAGTVAGMLGLRRPVNRGFVILGANELGHALGSLLRDGGEEVVFIDTNPAACEVVEKDRFRVIYGNANDDRIMRRARLEDRAASIAVTTNEEANLLFSRKAAREFKVPLIYLGIRKNQATVTPAMVEEEGGRILFGGPRDLELWAVRLRRRIAAVETWSLDSEGESEREEKPIDLSDALLFPLTVTRDNRVEPIHAERSLRSGDRLQVALFLERQTEAREELVKRGWRPAAPERDEPDAGQSG
jgi:NhaP-type Na+/H+ or K+/H+ antiporter